MLLACLVEGGLFSIQIRRIIMASDRDRNSDDRSSGHESKHGGHRSAPACTVEANTEVTTIMDPMIKIVIVVAEAIAKAVGPASVGLPQWMRINNAR